MVFEESASIQILCNTVNGELSNPVDHIQPQDFVDGFAKISYFDVGHNMEVRISPNLLHRLPGGSRVTINKQHQVIPFDYQPHSVNAALAIAAPGTPSTKSVPCSSRNYCASIEETIEEINHPARTSSPDKYFADLTNVQTARAQLSKKRPSQLIADPESSNADSEDDCEPASKLPLTSPPAVIQENDEPLKLRFIPLPKIPLFLLDELSKASKNLPNKVHDEAMHRHLVQIIHYWALSHVRQINSQDMRMLINRLMAEYPQIRSLNSDKPEKKTSQGYNAKKYRHGQTI